MSRCQRPIWAFGFFTLVWAGTALGDTSLRVVITNKKGDIYKNTPVTVMVLDANSQSIPTVPKKPLVTNSMGVIQFQFSHTWPKSNLKENRSMTVYFTLDNLPTRKIGGLIGERNHQIDVTLPGYP